MNQKKKIIIIIYKTHVNNATSNILHPQFDLCYKTSKCWKKSNSTMAMKYNNPKSKSTFYHIDNTWIQSTPFSPALIVELPKLFSVQSLSM